MMIRPEYLRFLQTLNIDEISADVRKVANLVLNHLNTLIPLTTAQGQGQRINQVVKLAQTDWATASAEIQPEQEPSVTQTCSVRKLKSISVGPFRGFGKQENFDLASELVLIYGPNGTGKSSFCEALEFGLLGNVTEAESKRFRNQQDYLKNAYTKSFVPPILIGQDSQGNDVSITPNETRYRFCFVEKNRIDNFSRIAAQAPSKQSELISALFGLDAFAEFVGNFTESMDGRYIDLEGVKAKELGKKRESLAGVEQNLKTMIPEAIQDIAKEEMYLAEKYNVAYTFSQMVAELNGTTDGIGLIKKLEADLQKQIPPKRNLTIISLEPLKQSLETGVKELTANQQKLSNASGEVSFKRLYDALVPLKERSSEKCSLSDTAFTGDYESFRSC